ncbi:hypothetical protein BG000_010543 [Podila horticola]|nr:hypothetical protein BG000_010543 [Podila horticola]
MIPDLMGKVVIVTGANGGVGYASTVALAAHGAHSAQTFLKVGLPLHILINSSGVEVAPIQLSADGLEYMFAVNHLEHFVFMLALLNRIKESQSSRTVTVSSWGHNDTGHPDGIDFTVLTNPSAVSSDLVRYCRSKLANILFTKALARRLTDERVYVNAPHPGHVSTNMAQAGRGTFAGSLFATITELFAMTTKEGALTQLYCATSPEIDNKDLRGKYFIPFGVESKCISLAEREDLQEKLREVSEKLMEEKVKGLPVRRVKANQ